MKFKFFSIYMLFSVISGILLLSCATSSVKKIDPVLQEEINRKVIAVTNIANLMEEDNLEGAYYRMDGTFRSGMSYDEFCTNWKKYTESLGKLSGFHINYDEYASLNFYRNILVNYEFDNGNMSARYLFKPTGLVPVDVIYGEADRKLVSADLPLKNLCNGYFKLGCGITGATEQGSAIRVPEFMDIVRTQFSSCTSTNLMKPAYVLNQTMSVKNYAKGNKEPGLNFSNIEKTLQWCQKNSVPLRGHTLVWHSQTPDWFFREAYKSDGDYVSREEMIERLDSFIRQYMTFVQENYPDVVYCWDVVNEAVDPEEGDSSTDFMCRIKNNNKDSGWYQTIGPDYPEIAFTVARKYAADGVKLFYNDYGAISKKKSEYIYNLCKSLKEKGLIDGIGIQGYWDIKNPGLKDIENIINKYAELGLQLQLTEWSIPAAAETEEGFMEQAERYASVFKLLQKLDTQGGGKADITTVSFFGVQDHFVLNANDTNNTRLYDKDFNPKPVYFSIQDVLRIYY